MRTISAYAWLDLNQHSPVCKTGALAIELQAWQFTQMPENTGIKHGLAKPTQTNDRPLFFPGFY
jgi:hypothetical protein